jgi:hypothetical protein
MSQHYPTGYAVLMKKLLCHIIVVGFFLFSFSLSYSQGVSVRASINRDKIMIGEPITLKLEAKLSTALEAKWFPLDTIPHFEFIDKGKIDSVVSGDFKIYSQTLSITSFDSGRWTLSSFPLEVGNREYLTDSLAVSVAYTNFDPNQDYHDIKDILEPANKDVKYINWILAALAVFSFAAIVYFLRKKSTVQQLVAVTKPMSKLSPLEEALESLGELQKQGYANGRVKAFHTGLNDTLRWYLYRSTNAATMEKTSGELMLQLKQFNLANEEFTSLAQSLRMNDAVKFAKYQPEPEENEASLHTIKKAIEQLDKIISS